MNHSETERVLVLFSGSEFFFLPVCWAEPQALVQGPWLGRCAVGRRRLTPLVSQMEDPSFPLGDLFQWLIILTQTQDYFFNDIPVDNIQKL